VTAVSEPFELCRSTLDLQINGAFGVDFAAADLTLPQMESCCRQLAEEGVQGFLATIITDTLDNLCGALQRLVAIRRESGLVAQMVVGFHVEGPFLSDQSGFVGAHDPKRTCDATITRAEAIFESAAGVLRLMTIAPERDRSGEVTQWLTQRGVLVSIGHSDAQLAEIERAIASGASLVTHYGNGCPLLMGRHDNILQRLLYFREKLNFMIIADGVHLPKFFLENVLGLIGVERLIVVSDAILAAGCAPGAYRLAGKAIRVDELGIPRTADGLYLAGSGWTQRKMDRWMASEMGWSATIREKLLCTNPRRILGWSK
jgi:N-acetylglucosamine-6-phosphate deacetylase